MTYACETPTAKIGQRITDMRLGGRPMQAGTRYKVVGWAPVAENATGERPSVGRALPEGPQDHRAAQSRTRPG